MQIVSSVLDWISRKVKSVDTWDGSPSRYGSTQAYCNACLINLNEAAGRENPDDWTQELCKLPVREPGETAYVRQALTAAAAALAGARTPMQKPDDVSAEDWQRALQSAARELIGAYEQAGDVAPDSVYETAGLEPPAERSAMVARLSRALGESSSYLVNVYRTQDDTYALTLKDGRLHRVFFDVTGDGIVTREGQFAEMGNESERRRAEGKVVVRRQADGKYRWFSRSCTAVLNRVGEIDSTRLFDNFVNRVQEYGYPYRTFFHQGKRFKTGQCDFVARDGYVLITSGVYDDTPLAAVEIAAVCRNPDRWGESIGYRPISREQHDIEGIGVPVYTDGYLVEISTLPEDQAAALFTQINVEEVNGMDQKVREALVALARSAGLSDDELEAWLAQVEATNRQIAEAAITARAVTTGELGQAGDTGGDSDGGADDGEDGLVQMARELVAQREALNQLAEQMRSFITEITARVDALEAAQNRQRQIYLSDLPAPQVEVWRPKVARDSGDAQESAAERARRILREKLTKEVKK